jgi:isopentenyldiphosphate isomerase
MGEMLDVYDQNLVLIGVKDREAVHRDGDWHRVFHCWIIYRDAHGVDRIVMQRRAATKQFSPNKLDVTAAGHYASGETIRDGVREVREELGIDVDFDSLISVGIKIDAMLQSGKIDHEFADVFLCVHDRSIQDYPFDSEEVAGLVSFAVADGIALFAGERDHLTADAVGVGAPQITIGRDDFVQRVDGYVYRVLVLAKGCLNGERHLVI